MSHPSRIRMTLQLLLAAMLILTACAPQATPAPQQATDTSAAPALSMDVPAGDPRETYYAPFPVAITLDGETADWRGVPRVTVPEGGGQPAITFALAADDTHLYMLGDVVDNNIISGNHGDQYWNEDSVEFYINGSGDLSMSDYNDSITQITVPALNIGKSQDEIILSGINSTTQGVQVVMFETDKGYAVEMSVPLVNDNWDLTPEHGKTIGLQVDLNGASTADRDTKLTWSIYDLGDTSYQNPSLFGKLIYYELGKADRPVFNPTPLPPPTATLPAVAADVPYKNKNLPIAARVEDLMSHMALSEKIGQMTLIEKNSLSFKAPEENFIGGVLSGGGGSPNVNLPKFWASMVDRYQDSALKARLGIPVIYGVDAVHGHNNVRGAVIFPHNIGLGAADDEELMTRIGRVTASEMISTGIYWNYAPVLAVVRDIRWGRTYESYGEDTELVTRLSTAYIKGLQGTKLSDPLSVAATLKHYVGDGGTTWGTSTTNNYKIDQGVTEVDEATLRAVHLPPYIAGIEAGARTVMVSYSSWGGMKMHAQKYLITDVLKGELGFTGFVVSDWGGIDQVAPLKYSESVVKAINAGVDMNMVPYDFKRFIRALTMAVEKGDVPMERIDDAVRRILTVKFEMGLFDHPYSNEAELDKVGSAEHRAVAREAVRKSLVLLKNENEALPLAKNTPVIFVAGVGANDIGMQSGGWTIQWQGGMGETTDGTTLLEALQATAASPDAVQYSAEGKFEPGTADACVVVVGELPYAEGVGDKEDLALSAADTQLVKKMRPTCLKLVVVLYSGRPMIITDELAEADAFVAAWLPGTEGQGLADVLFGTNNFSGKLPFTWPRTMDQIPFDLANPGTGDDASLFPFGYGLTYP